MERRALHRGLRLLVRRHLNLHCHLQPGGAARHLRIGNLLHAAGRGTDPLAAHRQQVAAAGQDRAERLGGHGAVAVRLPRLLGRPESLGLLRRGADDRSGQRAHVSRHADDVHQPRAARTPRHGQLDDPHLVGPRRRHRHHRRRQRRRTPGQLRGGLLARLCGQCRGRDLLLPLRAPELPCNRLR